MSIAVVITDRDTEALCDHLQTMLPGVLIQNWPNIETPEQVKLAVLWQHPPGICQSMVNLQQVISMGAGMDHIEADVSISEKISKDRIVTLALQQRMAQYVLSYVLSDWRFHAAYEKQQRVQQWVVLESDQVPVVGFLGLGALGSFVADRCHELGLQTIAWTAGSTHPLHRCVHGPEGLDMVCSAASYLVNLLPLNEDTHGFLDLSFFSKCQPDSTLIQVGRGAHLVETDLLQALDENMIRHVVLDVFQQEPLPPQHPFWAHPKITITPHSSARSDTQQTAMAIAEAYTQLS